MNKRGAEMVEYAIVLACIAAVGAFFYTQDNWDYIAGEGYGDTVLPLSFKSLLDHLFYIISKIIFESI